jgi:hypothetical protein
MQALQSTPNLTSLELTAARDTADVPPVAWTVPPAADVGWGGRLLLLRLDYTLKVPAAAMAAVGKFSTLEYLQFGVEGGTPAEALEPLTALQQLTELLVSGAHVTPQLCG